MEWRDEDGVGHEAWRATERQASAMRKRQSNAKLPPRTSRSVLSVVVQANDTALGRRKYTSVFQSRFQLHRTT